MAGLSYSAPERDQQVKLTSSYPATVCPAIGNNVSSIAALTSSKIDRRLIDGVSKRLNPGKGNVIPLKSNALLVEGNPGTSLTFANNGWKSVVPCSVSNGEQWFVGGSGGLTSKSFLYIVNSGFSESAVDLELFTLNGLVEPKIVTIPQNSTKKISIDSLVPGEESIAIAVKTKSGRVSSYLFDERKKGLKSLGADFVSPVGQARKQVIIPAISGLPGKLSSNTNSVSHTLRLLVPSSIDANVDISVNSDDGRFIPVGLSQLNVKSQRVLNVPLTFAPTNQPFSVIIDSDQPVLASVFSNFSYGKSSEIAWATGADELSKWSVNLTGSKPTLTFVGDRIDVQITATGSNGKKFEKKLTGSNFLVWRAPVGLNKLEVQANRSGIGGGVIFLPESGGIGSSYIPMNNGANLETASEPVADARVISRG
ncbi:unannotated protein [freshwater metagenome]|uniref:Unannotated protein n=1 Tax=freshwater metagenome TaxID=449393 RepID=A0A6J6KTN4_9ZZZZ